MICSNHNPGLKNRTCSAFVQRLTASSWHLIIPAPYAFLVHLGVPPSHFMTANAPGIPCLSSSQTFPLLIILPLWAAHPCSSLAFYNFKAGGPQRWGRGDSLFHRFFFFLISWRELISYLLSRASVGKLSLFLNSDNALKHHGNSRASYQSTEVSENRDTSGICFLGSLGGCMLTFFFFPFCFLGLHLWHMKFPG